MSKMMKRVGTTALALAMTASVAVIAVSCANNPNAQPGQYTYRTATTALGTNWNPHTWDTNADQAILLYVTQPFVDMSIKDSTKGEYQWGYEMATSVTDVTKEHQSDLTKYGATLQEGKTAETTESGFVFEIKLNPAAKWENGEKITADDYIYSMQQLLNPDMKNYRANLYIAGESALAGANGYYYNGELTWLDNAGNAAYTRDSLVKGSDGKYTTSAGEALVIALKESLSWLGGETLDNYVTQMPEYFDVDAYNSLLAKADENGRVEVTDETLALLEDVITASPDWGETETEVVNYMLYQYQFPEVTYDSVGCYKVDEYTIRYVNQTYIDTNYFLTSLTSTWLVYEDLYEAGKDTKGELVTTNYGTSKETTMSYGVYKIDSFQEERQIVFVQNENWYGFEEGEDGKLVSYTNFDVDGEKQLQYQTTRIVIDVMTPDAMKQAFLKGELTEWSLSATEYSTYKLSDQLYQVDETYTMSFFFNTNVNTLKKLDGTGNTNSVVLSNTNFRKAFSLSIDRSEYVAATPGYKPAYSLMSELYFYDVYNDPLSVYRNTDEAMQAICDLYGVEYGADKTYKTLEEAYKSINGYNLTEAKALMKTACDELVEAGLYTAGQPIKIRIAWTSGALTSDHNSQIALMNKYINAAAEGSGFGTITLEGVGNLSNRYDEVPNGNYAIGYGAWGGAAFYPFRNFQVYMDPDQYPVNETGCYDPKTETLTLTVNGEEETMTWQQWSNCMVGSNKYAAADFDTKLSITAQLEEAFLNTYYRIPLCTTTACSLLSYQCNNYTETYSIMYGFGGLRLMTYNYDDAEWYAFVKEQGGTLNYT